MGEEAKNIRLPEGLVERLLGGALVLLMGLALAGATVGISSFAASTIFERIAKIIVAEFTTVIAVYCFLVFIWCMFRPSWVQNTVNKVMKNFFPLVIIMSIGAVLVLSISLALA